MSGAHGGEKVVTGTPSIARMNSGVTRLILYPHSKMATYWYRYFLFTPRNIRRKFRSPVHSPSIVFTWTSRTPSPSSSRAHSPAAWQTTSRAQPVSAIRSYPRQSSVLTTAGGSAAPRTTPLSVSPSECSVTVSRTAPRGRPTTPQTGGRSLSQVPWPGARFPRRRGGSSGSRCGTPFFPRILVHLIGLRHLVVQPALVSEAISRVLEPVPQLKQLLAVAAQLAGELGVEHAVAARAPGIEDRVAVAVVDDQPVARPTPGAGQAVGVQPADELVVAG